MPNPHNEMKNKKSSPIQDQHCCKIIHWLHSNFCVKWSLFYFANKIHNKYHNAQYESQNIRNQVCVWINYKVFYKLKNLLCNKLLSKLQKTLVISCYYKIFSDSEALLRATYKHFFLSTGSPILKMSNKSTVGVSKV